MTNQQQQLQTPNEPMEAGRAFTPRVDIFENNDELLLIADVPGLAKDALNLRLEKSELHLEGKVPAEPHGLHEAFVYRRVFALPNGIDAEKASAELKQGVLRLRMPKSAGQRARTVPVTTA
jgi:HSP20 family molecular chaperone IbpA